MNKPGRLLHALISRLIPLLPGWSNERVRVVVLDTNGNILLIRSWLSHQRWTLPGGGVNQGESREAACVREVREETGLAIDPAALQFVVMLRSERLRADLPIYRVSVVDNRLPALKFPYNLEIIDRAWYPLKQLPPDVSQAIVEAVNRSIS